MAELTTKKRDKLPKSDFARPGKGDGPGGKGSGSYPIPDKEHAQKALQLSGDAPDIVAKVHAKFPDVGKSGSKSPKHKPTHGSGKLTAMGTKTLGALQDKHGAEEGRKKFHAAIKAGRIDGSKMFTQAQDDAYDKKHGIKEGSAADKKLDKKRGIKDES